MEINKKSLIMILFLIAFSVITLITYYFVKNKYDNTHDENKMVIKESDYNLNILKRTNVKNNDNYLISPYSIELALAMLRDGANGNTKSQIEDVIGKKNRIIDNKSVKIANGVFIKNDYKDIINKKYTKKLTTNHKAELLYDKFDKPDVINNWVNKKTDGMIPSILDEIDEDFVLGLANAIAIDVEWEQSFDGSFTMKEDFNKKDGSKKSVNMMHNTYETTGGADYLKSDKAQGIIIPYKEDTSLEFIAIMPNDNIDDYIANLTNDELKELENNKKTSNKKLHITLGLPKFSYSYDYNDFMNTLKDMGIKDAFDPSNADFTNIISKKDMKDNNIENLYVSTAIHKTYIDLNEKGTKAAAVTYFGLSKAGAVLDDYETINITFDKPFLYMIRDKKNHKVLFTGVVNNPNDYVKPSNNK